MRFEQPLIEGTLLRRNKRFLADVKLRNGDEITAHCAAAAGMLEGFEPGSKVLLSVQDDPKRKFKHQLEIVYAGRTPVAIHPRRPSTVVAEAVFAGTVTELAGYATMRRDIVYGRDARLDLVLEGNGLRACYVAVKNVTLAEGGVAYYPDKLAERDTRELTDLTNIIREGFRAMVFLLVPRADVERFQPGDHIDAVYGQALRDAAARGVELACYRALVTRQGIELGKRLQISL